MMSFKALCQAVESGNTSEAEDITRILLDEGTEPLEMIAVLTETMNKLGELFARLEIFLPQLILAGEALKAVVDILRPKIMETGEQGAPKGKVVIGVVKGDLHEIGKNIVKLMLETNGFEVKDLGYDVDSLTFIKEAEAMGADIIGASSLMTTTMPGQKEIIELLKDKGIRDQFKVVIGGAPTGQEWADQIGADLWCEEASSAPRMMAELLQKP
ncbi:MAG: corrinoid protein [Desulfobacterales bacterium]|jgi:corrinoid protein of di/trimethylamine methyltransferase